jgi:hypothetical protein
MFARRSSCAHPKGKIMRAEIEALAGEIRSSLALLRRHL